jgi:hypothetical protein
MHRSDEAYKLTSRVLLLHLIYQIHEPIAASPEENDGANGWKWFHYVDEGTSGIDASCTEIPSRRKLSVTWWNIWKKFLQRSCVY